jgi:hypothetical protein
VKPHRVLLVGLLAVSSACAACSTIQVRRDYDRSFDFSGFHTWSWLPLPVPEKIDPRVHNDLVDRRVRSAVERVLAAKGFRKVEQGQGDFGVGYLAAIEGKVDVQTINSFYGYGPGWGGGMGPPTETIVREYDQGTLVLDVVDTRTKRLVWRGSAQAEVSENRSPEARDERLNEAVTRMLAGFPPGS